MNIYLKHFLQRGLAFGGFGPIIAGIVFLSLSCSLPDFTLTGPQIFLAILSTYILAFIQAGASVFNQIESWSPARSILCHLGSIYTAYVGCYLINSWIPFKWDVILIFTAVFVAVYFAIWLSVYFSVKAVGKKLNKKL
ncbi:MAG: DUF3021 domain-containing protein [Clostridia bacterium]|nr:DUF3021 domain-containing protein [Clostridia bacterium]